MNRSQVISQIREALYRLAPGITEVRQGGMLAQIVILICCYC